MTSEEMRKLLKEKRDEVHNKLVTNRQKIANKFIKKGTPLEPGAIMAWWNGINEFDGNSDIGKQLNSKSRVIEALLNTMSIPIRDTNYLDITLQSRLGGIGAGSWYDNITEEQLLEAIISDDKTLSEFIPEAAQNGCTYYRIDLPGKNGITNIEELPEESPLYLSITHAGTGRLSVSTTTKVPAKDENETTIILGYEDGVGEVMFTMHPGLPIAPSDLTLDKLKEENPELKDIIERKSEELKAEGKDREDVVLQITKEQARALGFDMAKLTSDEFGRKLEEQQIDVRNVGKGKITLDTIESAVNMFKERSADLDER